MESSTLPAATSRRGLSDSVPAALPFMSVDPPPATTAATVRASAVGDEAGVIDSGGNCTRGGFGLMLAC
jgi:hypothetical protein